MSQFYRLYHHMIVWVVGMIISLVGFLPLVTTAQAPSIDDFFSSVSQGEQRVYSFNFIDPNKSIRENVIDMIVPAPISEGGSQARIRSMLRTIGVGVFLFMIIFYAGQLLIFGGDSSRRSGILKNIAIVVAGAFIFFGAAWILSTFITLNEPSSIERVVENINQNLFLQILGVLKVIAFFLAIIALVITGLRMMSAMDAEDKVSAARKGIVNIILAMLFIKLIDFIYFAAAQSDFKTTFKDLIIQGAVILGWILGAVLMIAVIVSGYYMIADGGSGERFKKGRDIIINILLVSLVVFLFLLIMYQLVSTF